MTTNKKRRKRGKKYFAEQEEQAVIGYILTDSQEEKHRLYNLYLRKPFKTMVEAILRKYSHHIGNYDINVVEANASSHLVEQFIKYRPFIIEYRTIGDEKWEKSREDENKFMFEEDALKKLHKLQSEDKTKEFQIYCSKAYSYCQTIVRNYYKDHSHKSYKEKTQVLSWEDHSASIMEKQEYLYEIDDNDKSDLEELIDIVVNSMRDRIDTDGTLKKNEIIVGEAIINVLSNWHILFLEETPDGKVNKKITNKYQKNKILQLLKEQTRLNTKEIRISMKQFKEIYFLQKKDFFADD